MKVLVLYFTKTGHTLEAIEPMAEGIRSAGSEATLVSTGEFRNSMLDVHDAIIVGSPCWKGIVGFTGAAAPIIKVLKALPSGCLENKTCGAIAVHAALGGKNTIAHIRRLMISKGCSNFTKGTVGKAGTLSGRTKGKSLSKSDEERFRDFGSEFSA